MWHTKWKCCDKCDCMGDCAYFVEVGEWICLECIDAEKKPETATEVTLKSENSICPECNEYCPDDKQVKMGMKCGKCA